MANKLNFYLNNTLVDICHSAKDLFLNYYNNNNFNFIVPGGSTPKLFFEYLSNLRIDWRSVTLILSDERLVSVNSDASNYRMLKKYLLEKLPIDNRPTIIPNMENYNDNEKDLFLEKINSLMKNILAVKIAFLGLGDDGHTASLFPGNLMDSKINYPYFIITKPREPFERITLSMAFLSNISNITFMVSGERKKNALLLLSKYKNDDAQIPSTELLRRSNAEIRVYCDQESFSTNLC
jgi:6-phosphogluconolactonase